MVKQYSNTRTVNRLISGSDASNPCGRPVVNLADGSGSKLDAKKEVSPNCLASSQLSNCSISEAGNIWVTY